MKRKMFVMVGLLTASVFIFTSAGLAAKEGKETEKTKRQLQEEAKKTAEERSKQVEQLKKTQELSERIIEQQKRILQQQQSLQDTFERAKVRATVVLDKTEVETGSSFSFEVSLANSSQKTFWVDGRKSSPSYQIFDEKGKRVAVSKNEKEPVLPAKGDLVPLKPGGSFTGAKREALAPAKPGLYSFEGRSTFLGPKEQMSDVWVGAIFATPVALKVVEKKGN